MESCACNSPRPERDDEHDKPVSRRDVLKTSARLAVAAGLLGGAAALGMREGDASAQEVWQIDPDKCVQCGRCATACVVEPSAVKCVHAYDICGYCDLCFAYFRPGTMEFDTGAEKQLCPTFAINREFVEPPYYEYTIDEARCIGCAKCVKGCQTFGNGSLYLQVRQDVCVGCNECAIAEACPAEALRRLPAETPYLLKGAKGGSKPVAQLNGPTRKAPTQCACCKPPREWSEERGDDHAV